MLSNTSNLGTLTAIHTDFGSNTGDLLVAEYDVPQTNVKQTLFYKYGQLSIPKWALIPASILGFGLLTALCAIIANSILSQSIATVTYSQTCSKTSQCKSDVGLTCGSASKCVCSSEQYWYENKCVGQPTYTQQCNQTTECRTDLGLICAEIEGQCNCPTTTKVRTCDCPSTSYWTGSTCTTRSSYQGVCSVADSSYQCISNLYCNSTMCICAPTTQYWNTTANECYSVDKYLDLCDPLTSYSCDASASLFCLSSGLGAQCPFNVTANSTSCDCANGTYWNGGSCVAKKSINSACFWNCECNSDVGLQCLNMSCTCPKKYYWSTASLCEPQKSYAQLSCSNSSECDGTQGLICYLSGSACNCPNNSLNGMCDCLTTQYYDFNVTACQTLKLYNETCYGNYMCDSTLGLFCQMSVSSVTNCSCPEPIRLNMCDCNMTSYWNGIACVSRLAPNISCSFEYQCQTGYTCIINETDNGIFSDVCRCPLGSYYVTGSGCVSSQNYTQFCIGSYQCYELAPLSCRYNDTGLTCLDTYNSPLPACDCQDNYYYNTTASRCLSRLNRLATCDTDCQCKSPYICDGSSQCNCPSFYSTLNKTCVDYLWYGDNCSSPAECEATPNASMTCLNGICRCNTTGSWVGTYCLYSANFRAICQNNGNCFGSLTCRSISCIDTNKRCSCASNQYYSPSNQSCISCTGSVGNYRKYAINYPTSDLCIAHRALSGSTSIPFSTANSDCSTLSPIYPSNGPQLISVHNQTELTCLTAVLQNANGFSTCSNKLYYLGLNTTSMTFFDGTPYTFTSGPTLTSSTCLTYCISSNTGQLYASTCSGVTFGRSYGAICDYRVL